jgi:hypothetical protein
MCQTQWLQLTGAMAKLIVLKTMFYEQNGLNLVYLNPFAKLCLFGI